MARSAYDPSFNPAAPPAKGLGFGSSVTGAYDRFRTGILGGGGGSGLSFGSSVASFNPYDFSTGPAITGYSALPPTVRFSGPPTPPTGGAFEFINSLIGGLGGFSAPQAPAIQAAPVVDVTGAVGAPVGAVVSPVTTDGGVGFLDSLRNAAAGLLDGIGAQQDTIEVTPVAGYGSGGYGRNPDTGSNNTVLIGLGIAAAVAFFALKK